MNKHINEWKSWFWLPLIYLWVPLLVLAAHLDECGHPVWAFIAGSPTLAVLVIAIVAAFSKPTGLEP